MTTNTFLIINWKQSEGPRIRVSNHAVCPAGVGPTCSHRASKQTWGFSREFSNLASSPWTDACPWFSLGKLQRTMSVLCPWLVTFYVGRGFLLHPQGMCGAGAPYSSPWVTGCAQKTIWAHRVAFPRVSTEAVMWAGVKTRSLFVIFDLQQPWLLNLTVSSTYVILFKKLISIYHYLGILSSVILFLVQCT